MKGCYKLHAEPREKSVNAQVEAGATSNEKDTAAAAIASVVGATSEVEKPSPIIEEWVLDFEQTVIQGIVYGYKDQEDGLEISTSRVRSRRRQLQLLLHGQHPRVQQSSGISRELL